MNHLDGPSAVLKSSPGPLPGDLSTLPELPLAGSPGPFDEEPAFFWGCSAEVLACLSVVLSLVFYCLLSGLAVWSALSPPDTGASLSSCMVLSSSFEIPTVPTLLPGETLFAYWGSLSLLDLECRSYDIYNVEYQLHRRSKDQTVALSFARGLQPKKAGRPLWRGAQGGSTSVHRYICIYTSIYICIDWLVVWRCSSLCRQMPQRQRALARCKQGGLAAHALFCRVV